MTVRTNDDEIDLSRIFFLLSKYRQRLIVLSLVGLLIGSIMTVARYVEDSKNPRHVISSSFAVVATNSNGYYTSNTTTPGYNDVKLATDIAESVIFVTKSDRTLSSAVDRMHFLGISNDEIRNNLVVTQYENTQIVTVKLSWPNAAEGLKIVQSICDVVPDILIDTLNLGSVSVVDYPKDLGIDQASIRWLYIPLAVMMTAGVYVAYKFLMYILHPPVTDVACVERDLNGIECLGVIPDDGGYFAARPFKVEADLDPDHYQVKDALISATHIIKSLVEHEGHKCLFFTSSVEGEGKTGIVANIAIELSKRDRKVLAIDLDTQRPALASCFDVQMDRDHSLNAVFDHTVEAKEAIIQVNDNLSLLLSRLEREKVRIDNFLVDKLKDVFDEYDIVLLDAPPVGLYADTITLHTLSNQAIMVVKYDKVWIETINQNVEKLRKSGIETCGSIVTNVKYLSGSGYGTYYYGHHSYSDYYGTSRHQVFKKSEKKERKKAFSLKKKKNSEDKSSL